MKTGFKLIEQAKLLLLASLLGVAASALAATNTIDSVEYSQLADQVLVKVVFRQAPSAAPASFTVSSPPRVAFDFPDTENGTGKSLLNVNMGPLKGINIAQGEQRLRLVLNMTATNAVESRMEGNTFFISLPQMVSLPKEKFHTTADATAQNATPAGKSGAAPNFENTSFSVNNVDFRADSIDQGTLRIDMSDPNALLDARQRGAELVITLVNSALVDRLIKRLDVRDYGTPIESITITRSGTSALITIANRGDWDYNVRQMDTQILVEVRRNVADPNALVGTRDLQGKVVSFNFTQPVPVGQMIGIFQEITGLNFMVMPCVSGEIQSLKMDNTPIDEAITVISRMYNLGFRRYGSIVVVGKADDLLKYDKDEKDRAAAMASVEPIQQETFHIKYRTASEVAASLQKTAAAAGGAGAGGGAQAGQKERSLITDRGMLIADDATNTIYVEESKSQMAKVRERIQALDRPSKQVLIEARYVEVSKDFLESLGVKLSNLNIPYSMSGIHSTAQGTTNNIAAGYATANLNFSLFDNRGTNLISLELDAGNQDSTTNVLAGPKLLTRDNQKASLKFGTKLVSATTATSGATPSVSYIDAVTLLDVKPQVQIDGKIQMQITVKNDSPQGAPIANLGTNINSRELNTNVIVENGGSILIGGMYATTDTNSEARVPFFGDLPYVGWLFKMRNTENKRTEMLIFLTARVVSEELTIQ